MNGGLGERGKRADFKTPQEMHKTQGKRKGRGRIGEYGRRYASGCGRSRTMFDA